MPRRLLILVLVIAASQAVPLSRLLPVLPGPDASASPSSDALMGSLPFPEAARRIDTIAQALPQTPGVVVAHTTADRAASAYFVLAMRLWPRPVSLVACQPSPGSEQFRIDQGRPHDRWRIDLRPGSDSPLQATRASIERDPVALCQGAGTPPEERPSLLEPTP
jgi:hypothetical protein